MYRHGLRFAAITGCVLLLMLHMTPSPADPEPPTRPVSNIEAQVPWADLVRDQNEARWYQHWAAVDYWNSVAAWGEAVAANQKAEAERAAAAKAAAAKKATVPAPSSNGHGAHTDAWWRGVSICEQGGRNDPYFGYFSIMDGSAGGLDWDTQVRMANAIIARAGERAWAASCVAAGYSKSPAG